MLINSHVNHVKLYLKIELIQSNCVSVIEKFLKIVHVWIHAILNSSLFNQTFGCLLHLRLPRENLCLSEIYGDSRASDWCNGQQDYIKLWHGNTYDYNFFLECSYYPKSDYFRGKYKYVFLKNNGSAYLHRIFLYFSRS